MTKEELETKTENVISETKNAIEIMYNALNQGQRKQIVKNEQVKKLFDQYKVDYDKGE